MLSSGFSYPGHAFPLVSKSRMFLPTVWLKLLCTHDVAGDLLLDGAGFAVHMQMGMCGAYVHVMYSLPTRGNGQECGPCLLA